MKKSRNFVYFLMTATAAPFMVLLRDLVGGSKAEVLLVLGSLAGFIGVVILFWQFLLGLRFISSKYSKDTVWFNQVHQKMGRYGVLFIFAHPFLKAITHYGSLAYLYLLDFNDPQFLEVSYGRIAFTLLLAVWITSVFFRKKLGFRMWKHIHYLSYLIMALVFFHAPLIGTYLNTYPFLQSYWSALSVTFGLIVVYRIAVFLGFGTVKYKLLNKEQVGDVFIYTFKTLGKAIVPSVGQYSYLKIKKFGEEHPFTVMESIPSEGTIVFGIKAVGKYTKKLSKFEVGAEIMVEGPYGVFTIEGHNAEPKVLIAGGIGVTPFVDLVREYGDEKTYMFYANRTIGTAVKRNELKEKLQERYFDVISDEEVSGENIISERLTEKIIKTSVPQKILDQAKYFICGSKPFYNNYKEMLLAMGVPRSMIFYEEFGF